MNTDTLLQSPLFVRHTDPATGIESFILAGSPATEGRREAPLRQSFYYVNPSLSDDSRFLWFYCAFPPAGSAHGGRTLGVADFEKHRIHHFPETQFTHASPWIDAATGNVYWCNETGIWTRLPDPADHARLACRFAPGFLRGREVHRIATHLTRTSDGRAFAFDAKIGNTWYGGLAPLRGRGVDEVGEIGEGDIWHAHTIANDNFNHAQACPADAGLILYANDHYTDGASGAVHRYRNRMWLLRRGEAPFPVYPQAVPTLSGERVLHGNPDRRSRHGHEWWSADGRHIWYIHYNRGVERVALADVLAAQAAGGARNPRADLVWPHPLLAHAHSNATDTALVLDSPVADDGGASGWRVTFVNLESGRDIDIVSRQPAARPSDARYHVHPHPQFCVGDELICFTTTVHGGRPDVAFARVADLVARTALS